MKKTLRRILLLSLLASTFSNTASAQNWKEVINAGVGLYAGGPVTADSSGYLYGVNFDGGTGQCYYGCGQVYRFQPNGHRLSAFLYDFTGTTDGNGPSGSVILDAKGNIYGVTYAGGDLTACGGQGCGVVYELSPGSSGWTESVLYNFEGGSDGMDPVSIIFDGKGNIFGLTASGGGSFNCQYGTDCGIAFELSPSTTGGWTETILHTFTGLADGGVPIGSLLLDKQGNLYGATGRGGNTACTAGCGVIFELSPGSSGWTFNTLYSFDGTHGATPMGSLVMDASGNLYGNANNGARATSSHCPYGCGSTFELSPSSSGWKLSLLHSYSNSLDGSNPYGGLLLDAKGNLYGAANSGGSQSSYCSNGYGQGCGVIFKFSPASGGKWIFDRLYTFQGFDGFGPYGDLLMDSSGNLYGTTQQGNSYGNLFELVPPSH